MAKIGGFERGMDQAERKSSRTAAQIARDQKKSAEDTQKAWANAGTAIGVGFTAATTALAVWIRGSITAIDQFNDLRDVSGATIENISALDDVARRTGHGFDQVSGTLIKFNQVLNEADPDKGPGAVLKALNLDIEELKRLDPAEALRQTAVAMKGFADDGSKARAAQELFGKAAKDIIPFLNDLAEEQKLVGSVTTQTAVEVDKFNKELAKFESNIEDVSRSLASYLVPAFNRVFDDITTFGEKAALAGLASDVRKFKKELDALQDRKGSPFNFAADLDSQIAEAARKLEAARAKFNAADVNRPKQVGGGRGFVNPPNASTLPSLDIPEDVKPIKTPRADPAIREAQTYLENLEKQLRATEQLSVEETVLRDIQEGRLKLVGGVTQEQLVALAQQLDLDKQLLAATEQFKKLDEETIERKKALKDAGLAVYESTRTPAEELNVELAKLNDLLTQGAVDWDTYARAVFGAQDAYEAATSGSKKTVNEMDKFAKTAAENIQGALGSGLADILNGEYDNIAQGFAKMLNRMIAEAMAAKLARHLFGDMVQGGTGSGAVGDAFGTFMKWITGASGKANGGGVMAGGLYEVNENGPEMLAMGGKQYLMMGNQGGTVIPTGAGSVTSGGSGGGVSLTIINQTGTQVQGSVQQRGTAPDGTQLLDLVLTAVADTISNGSGPVTRAMENRFGLRTAVS
ncbi:hypothetical protein [Hydrogenophaga sp. BPS33]|uniref:hypothetical protein n=1 Tax=Hydrogenophaga sp. BPS33 TaxID=2651974 RepID=UPI00131FFD64|nr:hypothetical protein [Hydrogenophaga sp. BPS33]QHE86510.1 hypothetical protein F9K07_17185 [Hydrogenophaga sp. BPS33]